jgi:hypothetical protein
MSDSWTKRDANSWNNPKLCSVGLAGRGLHEALISWSVANDTDGHITTDALRAVCAAHSYKHGNRLISDLLGVGLLVGCPPVTGEKPSWNIHDYEQFNRTKAQRKAASDHASSMAKARWKNAPSNAEAMLGAMQIKKEEEVTTPNGVVTSSTVSSLQTGARVRPAQPSAAGLTLVALPDEPLPAVKSTLDEFLDEVGAYEDIGYSTPTGSRNLNEPYNGPKLEAQVDCPHCDGSGREPGERAKCSLCLGYREIKQSTALALQNDEPF